MGNVKEFVAILNYDVIRPTYTSSFVLKGDKHKTEKFFNQQAELNTVWQLNGRDAARFSNPGGLAVMRWA